MNDFINTIDLLGDDVVLSSIIDRSIVEFKDKVIGLIRKYGFYSCKDLTNVDLPNVTKVDNYAFCLCSNLTHVDLGSVTNIGSSAFSSCTDLTNFIIRSNTLCTLENVNAFNYTAIKNGTGTIFVNDNLVDQYKQATNWSTYANQIKGISELGE